LPQQRQWQNPNAKETIIEMAVEEAVITEIVVHHQFKTRGLLLRSHPTKITKNPEEKETIITTE